jgi:Uma2 family endonuclease
MTEAIANTSFEDFLAAETKSPDRHELVGGRVYVMAGGTERHDLAAQALWETLVAGARTNGCRAFIGNRLLKTPSMATYHPDVMVVCGRAADEHYETNPTLIVEVLSPSTESIDRREKAENYARIESLHTFALMHPMFRRIEVARRDDAGQWRWNAFGPGDVWCTAYGDVDVDAIYDSIDADATT